MAPSFSDIDMVYDALIPAITIRSFAHDVSCKWHYNRTKFSDGESTERYWVAMRDARSAGCAGVHFVDCAGAGARAEAGAGAEAGVGAVEASLTYESID